MEFTQHVQQLSIIEFVCRA